MDSRDRRTKLRRVVVPDASARELGRRYRPQKSKNRPNQDRRESQRRLLALYF